MSGQSAKTPDEGTAALTDEQAERIKQAIRSVKIIDRRTGERRGVVYKRHDE